jgi:hypothetical protein
LLRTALAEPDLQLAAWRQLGPAFDLRTLEPGSISVLPLIYRNLSRGLPEETRLPHLKGVYRSAWVKNNLLADQLAAALDAYDSAGVDGVLVGSLGAAVRYYPEFGLRPSPALEFVVERGALLTASRALGRLGWSAATSARADDEQPIALVNSHGQVCVLRTMAAVELSLDHGALLRESVAVQVGRSTVRAPSAEHDLLAACAAGGRMKPVPSVQWLVDVARIAQAATPELDWERVLGLAREQGQAVRVHGTVAYLGNTLDVSLPAGAGRLRETPRVPVRERLAYRCAGAPATGLGSLPQAIGEHLNATRSSSGIEAVITFPEYLRRRWQLEHRWQLPIAGGRRIFDRITNRARPDRDLSGDRSAV